MAWTAARRAQHLTARDARKTPLLAHAGLTHVWTPEEAARHKAQAKQVTALSPGAGGLEALFLARGTELRRLCAERLAWWEVAAVDRRLAASPPEPVFLADTWHETYRAIFGHLPPRHLLADGFVVGLVKTGLIPLPPHPDDTDLVIAWRKGQAAFEAATAAAQQEVLPW